MSITAYWQIDTAQEPERAEPALRRPTPSLVSVPRGTAPNRYDYYRQVAEAASQAGFEAVYLPYRRDADESRIVAAAVARAVPRLKVIPEFPVSVGSAVYAAKQATSFQRSTHGRLGWAIAPSADAATRAAEGDFVAQEELAQRLEEFLTVARGVHTTRPFSFKGTYFEVENGGFAPPLNQTEFPAIILQGVTEEDLSFSARHADVHLFPAGSAETLARRIETLDIFAQRVDRSVAYGLIQPVLVRENDEEAQHDAARTTLQPGTLVGSYDAVAEQLAAYGALGITHFLLSASPALEEAYRVGRQLLPRLRRLTNDARAAA